MNLTVRVKPGSKLSEMHPDLSVLERATGTEFQIDQDLYRQFRHEADTTVPYLDEESKNAWAIINAQKHPGHVPWVVARPTAQEALPLTYQKAEDHPESKERQVKEAVALRECFDQHKQVMVESQDLISEVVRLNSKDTQKSIEALDGFLSDFKDSFDKGVATVTQELQASGRWFRAWQEYVMEKEKSEAAREELEEKKEHKRRVWLWVWRIAVIVSLICAAAIHSKAAPPDPLNVISVSDTAHALLVKPPDFHLQITGQTVIARLQFVSPSGAGVNVSAANPLPMYCISGCSGGGGGGGTSSLFGAAFPADGTAAGFIDASGNMAGANLDAGGRLITTGAGGTFPVTGTFWQATQPVSNAGTFAVQASQSGTWTVQPGNTANTTAWLVTGTGGTFPVTGTFWQTTQPVSGPLTDTQLRATAVPVSLTSTTITGSVAVTGPLTDTQLRATPVPVSGSITASCSTACEVSPTTAANTLANPFFNQLSDGTNAQTFMSTTTSSKHGADMNILSILGTAPTTAGFIDVKGADGNVFVRQATASNLNATVVGTGTFVVQATLAAETTKVIGTVNQGTSPWVDNVSQWGGASATGGSGIVTNGSPRVSLATDIPLPAGTNALGSVTVTGNVASGASDSGNPVKVGAVFNALPQPGEIGPLSLQTGQRGDLQMDQFGRVLTHDPDDNATRALLVSLTQAVSSLQFKVGAFKQPVSSTNPMPVASVSQDPCAGPVGINKFSIPISQTGNTKYVTGIGHRILICSILLVGTDAENVSLVEGTGSVCGTNTLAVIGGATAANGPNLAANGGFAHGVGAGSIAAVNVSGDDVCLFESGSGRVSGVMMVAVSQ